MQVTGGATDVTTYFALRLAADGTAATGLTITNLDLQYTRSGVAPTAKVDATALAATDSAHADNKAFEIDSTDQPGLYRVDWPDAAFAAGVPEVLLTVKVATAFTEHLAVQIDAPVNVTTIEADSQSATDLKDFADAGYDPDTNKVQGVVLVDTTTANSDMVGTDNAALASVCTEARLAELAAGNLPSDVDAILADTNELQADDVPGLIGALNDPTAATVAGAVCDEALSGHQTQGTLGAAVTLLPYLGPRGYGVYLDDGAANTSTVVGIDGTREKPVSTIAAATTIATGLGLQRIYLINDTLITLAQTYEAWEFVGIGLGNQITLGSQNVKNSQFDMMMLTGTQGGTGMININNCSMNGLVGLECIANHCYLTGTNTIRASSLILFNGCKSAVPGNNTPELTFSGGASAVMFAHYSAGLQINGMGTGDVMSLQTDGQVIVDATCTDGDLTVRGTLDVTDNSGGAVTITQTAALNRATIAAAVVDLWNTATHAEVSGIPAAVSSHKDRLAWLFALARNKGLQNSTLKTLRDDGDTADIATSAISSDGTTFTRNKWT